jgi:hypothetical protein
MDFRTIAERCHVRSAIYRTADPQRKYAKNHPIPLASRVPAMDQVRTDWAEWDPNEEYSTSLPAD